MVDKELEQQSAAYVAEHGYYITVPRLSDVVHLGTPPEPNTQEFNLWRDGDYRALGLQRYGQISQLMDSKQRRFDQALASPTPTWGKNVTSVMTFFDDWNDWLGTAGVALRFAAHFAPRVMARFLLGPAGWLFLAADIANILMTLMSIASPAAILLACVQRKAAYEKMRTLNPFNQRSKAARARKLRRFLPSKGEALEALQTTDNIWGVGLSLGPIMGFAQDVLTGAYRAARGERVTWITPPPPMRQYERKGILHIRNAQILAQAGQFLSDADHFWIYLSLNGAIQMIRPYIELWNPLDKCSGLQHVELRAPTPQYESTKWMLRQNDVLEGEGVGWTGLNKEFATYEELWDFNAWRAADHLMEYATRNRKNIVGAVGCQNAADFGRTVAWLASD
jgi:hypothetical protein